MLRPAALAAGLLWAYCIGASAQTPNPVIQHYRAYQAALEAGDLVAAEREAAAALTASEERDGEGGRTGVLALNLASVRFQNHNVAGAVEPARRALAISQSVGEERSGVSPVLAQLILRRAELAGGDASAAERLAAALEAAQRARLAPEEIYDAASELGAWSFRHDRFDESRQAWSVAASYAEGSRFGAQFSRASSLTGGAAAMLMADLQGRQTEELSEDVARDAWQMLNEAVIALRPLAEMNTEGEVTLAQRSYAQSLAWRSILRAKLETHRQEVPTFAEAQGDADGFSEVDVPATPTPLPRCLVRVVPRDNSTLFPSEALTDRRIGAVAVRFRINENGRLEDIQSLAVVGGEDFGESVEHRRSNWRVQRRDDSPSPCRMGMSVITPIAFRQ